MHSGELYPIATSEFRSFTVPSTHSIGTTIIQANNETVFLINIF